jgi:PKD repeat protein
MANGVLGREIMNARVWRTGTILVLLLSLVTLAGWGQGVAPKGIIPTPPESTALQVSIWVDRGAYAVGESITIHYSVNKPAYVYIWDITPDGQAQKIFPNDAVPGWSQNYVTAGEHTLSGTIDPPLGTEYLQILATTSPVDPFAAFTGDPQALQAQVQVQILGILPVSERGWNFTSFEIVQGSTSAYGRLVISSTPSGASIYVNGAYVGYTPRTVYVRPYFPLVALAMPGYQTRQETVFVFGGQTKTISWSLQSSTPTNQSPVSMFTYTPPTPGVGEYVQFNGLASRDPDGSISTYAWSFGDGSTGVDPVPWYRYLSAGTYTVSLTVTDNRGASATSSQIVRIGAMNQQPVPSFITDPAIGTPGGWIKFDASTSYDLDGAIGSYAWNFGDGRTGTGGPIFWQQYASAGAYSVTLTVTDNLGATAAVTRIAQVGSMNQSPSASFAVLPPAPSVAAWARFDATASTDPDGSIVSYQWSFGDGATATGNVVYHQFTSAGTFPVTLTVTDNGGATNSATQPVQVGTPMQAPVASFTFSPSSPIVGSPVVFNASSSYDPDGVIVSYQWDLNGDGTVDTTGATGQVTYSSPRTAVVRLTVTDNSGLSTSTTQTIVVSLPGGGSSGAPAMGATAGFFVWGSDTWHVTVNAGAGWIAPRNYRIELRTDGQFSGLNESWSGGVAPLGIVPTPATSGKTLILEGSIQAGSVDYTFTIPGAKSMWMSFKMDQNGDGTLEESTSFVYLRGLMVRAPYNPLVVGLRSLTGPLTPSLNFWTGYSFRYDVAGTPAVIGIGWGVQIGVLESL